MKIYDDDGEEISLAKWTHKAVCPRCRGKGVHVNPNIDGHGISTDDECWQDDDFRGMYLGGGYDVTCHECQGHNVVDELDEAWLERDQPDLYRRWTEALADEAEYRSIQRMEMMAEGSWW